ncbi:MAG: hypothetical protein AB1480_09660 [Nitrospirota bacterium]
MSEYQIIRVPRLRLRSLLAIKEKLDMKELSCLNVDFEYLTSQERTRSLGESISRYLRVSSQDSNKLRETNPQIRRTIDFMSKAISLEKALSEEKHLLLHSMVTRTLSSKDMITLNNSKEFLKTGNMIRLSTMKVDAENLLQKLTEAVKSAHQKLEEAEREVLAEKTIESLTAIGYRVKSKPVGADLLIRGKKQDLSIAAQITQKGELHIDMAGFEGGLCRKELNRLNGELSNRGIDFEVIKRQYHGKKGGGVLAQRAEKEISVEFNPLQRILVKENSREKRNRRIMQLRHLHHINQRQKGVIG